MMKVLSKYIPLLCILFLCSRAAQAQNQSIDSIKKVLAIQKEDTSKIHTLLSLSWEYRFSFPDSSLVYAQKALSLAEKIHSDESIFWSIVGINQSLFVLGNYA